MAFQELDELRDDISARAKAASLPLEGPADTAYGVGWLPTTSFWSGNRRIHFYIDSSEEEWDDFWGVAEVSDADSPEPRPVWMTKFRTEEEAWRLVRSYVIDKIPLPSRPGSEWELITKTSHDASIPHPPSQYLPGNFAPMFSQRTEGGNYQPAQESTFETSIQRPAVIALVKVVTPPNLREPEVNNPIGCVGYFLWRFFRRNDRVTVQTIERFKGDVPDTFSFRAPDYGFGQLMSGREFRTGDRALVFLDRNKEESSLYLGSQMPLSDRGGQTVAETFVLSSSFWRGIGYIKEGTRRFVIWSELRNWLLAKCRPTFN